jgi:hypothetical protein
MPFAFALASAFPFAMGFQRMFTSDGKKERVQLKKKKTKRKTNCLLLVCQ